MATPILSGFPDTTTTGVPAGVTLTPHIGDLVINTPGAVISGLNITGTVYVNAPNVTIENCRIDANGGYFCIDAGATNGASGLTVTDCTLLNSVPGKVDGQNILCTGATILRCDMSGMSHCISSDGGNLIQDNYMHDLNGTVNGHYECIYVGGGAPGDTIRHNTMISFDTAVVFMKTDYGPVNNMIVDNNLMLQQSPVPVAGLHTTSYDIYLDNTGDGMTGNVVTNNIMQQGYYGYSSVTNAGVVWQGNTDISTGQTISVNGTLSPAPTGPSAPVITSFSPDTGVVGDGITDANKLDVKGTADPNSTIKVYDGATQIGTTTASSTGSWDYITSVLADAKHVLTATATNAASQTSAASAALTVKVDTLAPVAPVETGASIVSGTTKVQLTGTAEANSTLQVFDGANQIGTATANSSGAWSLTTGTLTSGGHSFTTKATDAAGNTSLASAALAVTIPSAPVAPPTAPAAPTIASFSTDSGVVGDHITNDNTLTLSGAAVANSTVKVFDGTTQIATATADSSGAWSSTATTALADGSHNLTATATNASGTSTASAALAVTIDTHAPAAPVETGASIVSGTTKVQLTGTAEANSTLQVFDGATQVGTATANSSGAWSLTTGTLTSGGHSFTTKATDAAGNTSLASAALAVTIPSAPSAPPTAPAAPTIAKFSTDSGVVGDHITNDNTLTLSGAAVANSTVKVFDGTTQVATATADSSGAWSSTATALADGSHNLTATATNASGTSTASAALAVTIDTHAPAAPIEVGDSIVNGAQVQLTGTAEANSALHVFDGTTLVGTTTTNATGNWTVMTSPLSTGAHNLTATATDAAGNTSAASLPLDPVIGTAIELAGSTSLDQVGNNFYLSSISSGSSPELKYHGAAVAAAQFGAWAPIGVEQTATGYEVAWKVTGSNQYTVWNTDSNGNYVSNAVGAVSGTSSALESLETSFHQDLNGDGVIGLPKTAIESAGSTSLVEVGNNFYLNNITSGSGPELKYSGAAVAAGQFGAWAPIGVGADSNRV